ncbi:MAG: phosphonate C-P lyase system protein PhnH [Candidatus Thiodiazotropha sp.]
MLDVDAIWTPSVQQQNYRALLEAISRPGMVKPLHTTQGGQAATAILATLLDAEVSLADMHDLLDASDWPMLQASSGVLEEADYVFCDGSRCQAFQPKLGSLPSPEQSATLIIKVDSVKRGGLRLRLSGPGVNGNTHCAITGLDPDWLSQRENWVAAFPLGVDLFLVDDSDVVALPRTTKVEVC